MGNFSNNQIYYSTNEMQYLFTDTAFTPKQWLKNSLTEIEFRIISLREKNRVYLKSINWLPKTESIIDQFNKKTIDFLIPTLHTPDFFNKTLTTDLKTAVSLICKALPQENDIFKILSKANLQPEQNRFYCLEENDELNIYGSSHPIIGNLLFLAHEIGHCLYELKNKNDDLGSEIYAFLFEDFIANTILNSSDIKDWNQYKKDQDSLNFKLATEELIEFKTGILQRPAGHLFFRESLVTTWGYQYINCVASLKRMSI